MLIPKNNANLMRTKILIKLAESYLENKFEDADRIPLSLRPKDGEVSRCCVYKDRAVLKYRCMAGLGHCPEEEVDELTSLKEYGQEALKRTQAPKNKLSVIDVACSACIKSQYVITDVCRGCFAQPCRLNCPKQAISIVNGRAHIDPDLCVNCGKCYEVCPYHSVVKIPVPCEEACPVGAITKDEHGKEHIDTEKCISCGKCLASCPFGAIVERSQMIDVIKQIKETDKKVIAMLAPAIAGQFPGSLNNLAGALKKFGFSDVIEVAVGADITTQKEAAEFIERMEAGQPFMTTSCCPAYYRATQVHLPEIRPFVSETRTPMYYTAELMKQEQPDCITVFVGPCLAKRAEAETDSNVDYVLTFEELGAMLVASGINVDECEEIPFGKISHAQGRLFPVSGGVAGAVADMVNGKADFRPEKIDGLTKENIKLLKRYAAKGGESNMLEVMCCEGGCVSGPGCIALSKRAARAVDAYAKEGEQLTPETKIV
ncbi:MAG: 4Fe-4S dicluster domain-containing protein [Alphaproteobacteria bacterium]|nr:4Fe-4S dicluster domain-containing protein [Alphaproteobacteria bacterium]